MPAMNNPNKSKWNPLWYAVQALIVFVFVYGNYEQAIIENRPPQILPSIAAGVLVALTFTVICAMIIEGTKSLYRTVRDRVFLPLIGYGGKPSDQGRSPSITGGSGKLPEYLGRRRIGQ